MTYAARILRAIRIAARLEFSLATSTATAIRQLKSSLLGLNKVYLFITTYIYLPDLWLEFDELLFYLYIVLRVLSRSAVANPN